jgi:hypothetical protein
VPAYKASCTPWGTHMYVFPAHNCCSAISIFQCGLRSEKATHFCRREMYNDYFTGTTSFTQDAISPKSFPLYLQIDYLCHCNDTFSLIMLSLYQVYELNSHVKDCVRICSNSANVG